MENAGVWDVQSGGIVAQHALLRSMLCFVFAWQHMLMLSSHMRMRAGLRGCLLRRAVPDGCRHPGDDAHHGGGARED